MSLLSPNLEAFVAVARLQSVHGAARELLLTQTGVTQRIRALEASLAATLFTRSRMGMRLTPEGAALLRYCQGARELEGQALAQITGAGKSTAARICLTGPSSLMNSRAIPACLPVLARFRQLTVTFEINDIENREESLRSGKAQLALLPREKVAKEMDSKLLKPEKYVLVGPPGWKKRRLADIVANERIGDFDPTDQMTFSYLRKFGLLSKTPPPERHFLNNTSALIQLFKASQGYGVLTAEFAAPALKRGDLVLLNSGAFLEYEVALAWYPRPRMPEYFRALVAAIR